jgi:hypothetical protein
VVSYVLVIVSTPASAASIPTLESYIISDPEPGWSALPASVVHADATAAAEEQSEIAGQNVTAAYQKWESPNGRMMLTVAILQYGSNLPDNTANAETAVNSGCSQSGRTLSVVADAAIPFSQEAICSGSWIGSNPPTTTAIAWSEGDVLVEVAGYGNLAASAVASAALSQYQAIPPGGVGAAGHNRLYEVAGAAFALFLIVVMLLALRSPRASRRRRRNAVPLPAGPVPRTYRGAFEPPAAGGAASASARHLSRQYDWSGDRAAPPVYRPPGMIVGPAEYRPPGVDDLEPELPPFRPLVHRPLGAALQSPPPIADQSPTLPSPAGATDQPTAAQPGPKALEPPVPDGPAAIPEPPPVVPVVHHPAAWYQVNGSQYDLAYFDGSSWIARKHWDGQAWVDVT